MLPRDVWHDGRLKIRIGLHLSISLSMASAAERAAALGAHAFQIFTSSPRMWRATRPGPIDIARLCNVRLQHRLTPLVVHDNYLINLAAADPEVRQRSIVAFRGEVERAVAVGAEYLVAHPGSYKDQTVEQAFQHFTESLAEATRTAACGSLKLLLECTAGQGSAMGSRLEELAVLKMMAEGRTPLPIGFCLDTCHLYSSGYDIGTADGLNRTLDQADELLGLDHIPVIHANDSKTPLGSRIDRHENIGRGTIGRDGFQRILRHPGLEGKAFILETPMDEDEDQVRDLEALRELASGA